MKRKTLRKRAEEGVRKTVGRDAVGMVWEYERELWLAGYRAGKREGKAEAMKATGWGKP